MPFVPGRISTGRCFCRGWDAVPGAGSRTGRILKDLSGISWKRLMTGNGMKRPGPGSGGISPGSAPARRPLTWATAAGSRRRSARLQGAGWTPSTYMKTRPGPVFINRQVVFRVCASILFLPLLRGCCGSFCSPVPKAPARAMTAGDRSWRSGSRTAQIYWSAGSYSGKPSALSGSTGTCSEIMKT